MSTAKVAAAPKTASVSSEIVLGSGIVELKKVLASMDNAHAKFSGLIETAEKLQIEIAAKEDKLKQLDVEQEEKIRANAVLFDLQVKADQNRVVEEVLTAQNKMAVLKVVFESLTQNLESYKTDFADKVKHDVDAASRGIAANFENKSKLLEAEYKAKEAGNLAEIAQLNKQVTFLTTELERWKKALDDERAASVERAKASSISTLNVGNGFGK